MSRKQHLPLAVLLAAVLQSSLLAQAAPQATPATPQAAPVVAQNGLRLLGLSPRVVEGVRIMNESHELSKSGDEAAQEKAWLAAIGLYKQALGLWKENPYADYGLAQCYAALGDKAKEIEAYRADIFNGEAKPGNVREQNIAKLMNYVLLLSQVGQVDEAVYVYNDAAKKMDDHERPSQVGLPLPLFGSGPGQASYTPARLQAMAHVGLGLDTSDNNWTKPQDKLAHLQEAVRLAPDCADTYYHLGRHLERLNPAQAQAAYEKGAKLDSLIPGAAARMAAGKPL